ncbi:PCC domain-containing protein [Synechococcus sp. CS-197]|uniref:PCC domain-containing protein n=1 Tax=Synechococcus sp. CS-197 TaxID=2847985 RepID=UPI0001524FFB|nr:DUF296 domain-containing protein [Synechococcus sp. CS-197]MCT0252025.1 DUF296 domain-containing protein [Synechococcus sp. CS-197]CAK23601.1 Protein containing glutaredoxin domain and PD1-like DNA-binding domain, specific to cyanobacteria [Synechococcus sp. WH 7803]
MDTLTLNLEPGQDLHQSLHQLASDQQLSGFVLGVVGDLSEACFQCPGQPQPTRMQGVLEVITLNGTVSPQGVHLHLSLSDGACQVWGGHLEAGTTVHKGVQLLLGLDAATAQTAPISQERVELAVLPGCPFCHRARQLLERQGIPHTIISVESDSVFEACQKRSGLRVFPQIFVDGDYFGDYTALQQLHQSGQIESLR